MKSAAHVCEVGEVSNNTLFINPVSLYMSFHVGVWVMVNFSLLAAAKFELVKVVFN
jgi:hypothetical protein